jgi:hypothetical protein
MLRFLASRPGRGSGSRPKPIWQPVARSRRGSGNSRRQSNEAGSLSARCEPAASCAEGVAGGLFAPVLDIACRALTHQPRARCRRRGPKPGIRDERLQSLCQPQLEPAGVRRARSPAMGAAWQHAISLDQPDDIGRYSLRSLRTRRAHGFVRNADHSLTLAVLCWHAHSVF